MRFLNYNYNYLISYFVTSIDCNCYTTNSLSKYKLYFKLLEDKIKEYNINASNMYNIDKKGFIISITSRLKHIFSKVI